MIAKSIKTQPPFPIAVHIRKGVKPYGGRKVEMVALNRYRNGRLEVVLIPSFNKFGAMPKMYRTDEVILPEGMTWESLPVKDV